LSRVAAKASVLVYAQAVPRHIPGGVDKFSDLSKATFSLGHSSKAALNRAKRTRKEIVAIGHSAILAEALTRGAAKVLPVSLCDDPFEQAMTLPKNNRWANVIIGENPDGPFTGASLSGALSAIWGWTLVLDNSLDKEPEPYPPSSIILVKDDIDQAYNIDVRQIVPALEKKIRHSDVKGTLQLLRQRAEPRHETLNADSPNEIATSILRRLRRFRQMNVGGDSNT
jgi:hypothetical protein